MTAIKEVTTPEEKSAICNNILRALPDWFGIEESIVNYVAGVKDKPFYGIFDGDRAVGFVSIRVHSQYTAEIYVMGILEGYHRQGLGKKIVTICEDYCRVRGMEFLTVKTVAASSKDPYYARTRKFYEAVGFRPLEVFPDLWDAANPCLFLVKVVDITMH